MHKFQTFWNFRQAVHALFSILPHVATNVSRIDTKWYEPMRKLCVNQNACKCQGGLRLPASQRPGTRNAPSPPGSRMASTVGCGLSRMEGVRERGGNGVGVGTGTPFRDKPPRLSRKGALRAGSSINVPLRDNRVGGSSRVVCWVVFRQRFYKIVLIFSLFFSSFHLAGSSFLFKDGVEKIIERNLKRKEREIIMKHFCLCKINRINEICIKNT